MKGRGDAARPQNPYLTPTLKPCASSGEVLNTGCGRANWLEANSASIVLRVDGGMAASDWTMQRFADLLNAPVDRPMIQETTAFGAPYLVGLAASVYPEPAKFADNWRLKHRFKPNMSAATSERKLTGGRGP
jgi:glycerol kinase